MNLFAALVFFALGVGRNLPYQNFYFYGMGVAEFLFMSFLVCLLLLRPRVVVELGEDVRVLQIPIVAILGVALFSLSSLLYNSVHYGADVRDLFEILRYVYSLIIMVASRWTTRLLGVSATTGFVTGVLLTGMVGLLNPMNPNVQGTPQIFNPNVLGNALSVSIVFCSALILCGRPVHGGILAVMSATVSFFTFSKGTWIMSVLGLIACWISLLRSRFYLSTHTSKSSRYFAYVMFVMFLLCVTYHYDLVSNIVKAKIAATDFAASAVEGGSFSARAGLMLSAFYMFLENPLFGVGISNFEQVNALLASTLGSFYYADDNPNSAFLYVLGCMGLPAFLCFCWIFGSFVRSAFRINFLRGWSRHVFGGCVAVVFFIGGNVQVEMLKAYYFWVALGVFSALSSAQRRLLREGTS